jgi:hypothetical protein
VTKDFDYAPFGVIGFDIGHPFWTQWQQPMRSGIAALGRACRPLLEKPFTKLFAVIVAALCGCSQSPKAYDKMSDRERLDYLREQAHHALIVEASNAVPGIRDILEADADTLNDSVDKWNGSVRVSYLTQSGGIELTNVPMAFIVTFDGRLFACGPSKLDGPVVENK